MSRHLDIEANSSAAHKQSSRSVASPRAQHIDGPNLRIAKPCDHRRWIFRQPAAPPQNHFHRRWAKLRSLRRPHSIHHRRRRSPPPAQSHLRPSQKPIAPRSQSPRERAPPSQARSQRRQTPSPSPSARTHRERAANSVQHAPRPQQDSRTQHSSLRGEIREVRSRVRHADQQPLSLSTLSALRRTPLKSRYTKSRHR